MLSVHSSDRTIEPSVIGRLCLIPTLLCTVIMPETRKSKGKGKEVEVRVGLAIQRRQCNEGQDESPLQTSPTMSASNELWGSEIPPELPADATV